MLRNNKEEDKKPKVTHRGKTFEPTCHVDYKENSYGGSLFDSGQDIVEGPSGSYFLTGFSQSSDGNLINNKGNNDIAILHITSFKAIINSLNIGVSKIDIGNSSVFNRSGSLFVVGSSNSSDGDFTFSFGGSDLFVAKYD